MKFIRVPHTHKTFVAGLVAAALTGFSPVHADVVPGKTRAQVQSELTEAIRTGDIYAGGDTTLKMNELSPQLYPEKQPVAVDKTRAQVQSELTEAIRTGDVYAGGESTLKQNELFPASYPPKSVALSKPGALDRTL